ncbi:MAG: tRNA pseudouridine(55) synthase TruB [Dehalococcoidales bacterium]|nr:MAG: tRNA pseudouridine(55) synthase TruB [Dehalococcoidales bacterium]
MDGILNVNKPSGVTSFSVVSIIKRLSGQRRVGHAGTLDPAATGVLPVAFGQGTRVIEYLMDTSKTYHAEIELGTSTDTYDGSGKVTRSKDPSGIRWEQVVSALASLNSQGCQTPPMYSALKYHGKPLYKWARAGINITREPRPVNIHKIELLSWQPPLVTIEVVCGKGTYIRCLADDLGELLGCGAYLKNLVRLRCGIFNIEDAISLPQLEDAFRYGYWQQLIYHLDRVVANWKAILVDDDMKQKIGNGRSIVVDEEGVVEGSIYNEQQLPPSSSSGEYCRAYTLDGWFLGVLRFNPERMEWQPVKVFI